MSHSTVYSLLRDYDVSALDYALLWTIVQELIIIFQPWLFNVVGPAFSFFSFLLFFLETQNHTYLFPHHPGGHESEIIVTVPKSRVGRTILPPDSFFLFISSCLLQQIFNNIIFMNTTLVFSSIPFSLKVVDLFW